VRTALAICTSQESKTIRCFVRVDGRIDVDCLAQGTELDRLYSLLDMIKVLEANPKLSKGMYNYQLTQFVDRIWLESRIYRLEEEIYEGAMKRGAFERGVELFAELKEDIESKTTAFVILGKIDACHWMLHTPPFPWTPRMPKETEMYQLKWSGQPKKWERIFLGTFTPRLYHLSFNASNELRRRLDSSELHAHMFPSASKQHRSSRPGTNPGSPESQSGHVDNPDLAEPQTSTQ
jgi:hypothetical protein